MIYTFSIIARRLSSFLINLMIARIVSIQEFGDYSNYIILSTYFLLLTEMGYSEYILLKSKQNNNLNFLLTNFISLSFFTFFVITLISSLFYESYLLTLVLGKVYLDIYLNKLLLTHYQYKDHLKQYAYLNIGLSISLLLAIAFFWVSPISLEHMLLFIDIILLGFVFIVLKKTNITSRFINLTKFKQYFNKEFLYYALSSITIPLYMQLPLVIMTFFVPKDDIAIFFIAYSISSVMLLVSISINQQYLPKLIHNPEVNFSEYIKAPIVLLLLFNLIVMLFFIFFGEYILIKLFNKPEYINANIFIILLMIANLFQSTSGLIALYLVSKGLMKKKFIIHLELIVISLIVSFILIPYYDLKGVAMSYILIYIYALIRYFSFTKKRLDLVQ